MQNLKGPMLHLVGHLEDLRNWSMELLAAYRHLASLC